MINSEVSLVISNTLICSFCNKGPALLLETSLVIEWTLVYLFFDEGLKIFLNSMNYNKTSHVDGRIVVCYSS